MSELPKVDGITFVGKPGGTYFGGGFVIAPDVNSSSG